MSELTSGGIVGTEGGRTLGWFIEASHQWDSFTPGCNWRDFTLLHIGGEWAEITGRIEVTIAVMGLSVTVTYVYNDVFVREMMHRREDFIEREKQGPVLS